jgi:hypothetical protein
MPGESQDFFAILPHPHAALVEGQIKRLEARKEVIAEAKATITNEQTLAILADKRNLALFLNSWLQLAKATSKARNNKPLSDIILLSNNPEPKSIFPMAGYR